MSEFLLHPTPTTAHGMQNIAFGIFPNGVHSFTFDPSKVKLLKASYREDGGPVTIDLLVNNKVTTGQRPVTLKISANKVEENDTVTPTPPTDRPIALDNDYGWRLIICPLPRHF